MLEYESVRYITFLDRGSDKRQRLILLGMYVVLILVSVLSGLGVYALFDSSNRQSGNAAVLNMKIDTNANQVADGVPRAFIITVHVIELNTRLNIAKFMLRVTRTANTMPTGNLLLGTKKVVPITEEIFLGEHDRIANMDGDENAYPFDVYRARLLFAATAGSPFDPASKQLDYGAITYASIQNWKFAFKFQPSRKNPNLVKLEMTAWRSRLVLAFSIFVNVFLWLMALSSMLLTYQLVVRRRDEFTRLITAHVGLVISLPAMRSNQPNIPKIGTMSDRIGLFFAETIVIIDLLIICWVWASLAKEPYKDAETEIPCHPTELEEGGHETPTGAHRDSKRVSVVRSA